jgi:hypothetical protein
VLPTFADRCAHIASSSLFWTHTHTQTVLRVSRIAFSFFFLSWCWWWWWTSSITRTPCGRDPPRTSTHANDRRKRKSRGIIIRNNRRKSIRFRNLIFIFLFLFLTFCGNDKIQNVWVGFNCWRSRWFIDI